MVQDRAGEAVPLPLRVIKQLEEALKAECGKDSWILCCILLMVWCSLRWSDCQRVQVDTISKFEDIMAGCSATVRDKSRLTARPRAGPRGRLQAQPAAPAALTQDRAQFCQRTPVERQTGLVVQT